MVKPSTGFVDANPITGVTPPGRCGMPPQRMDMRYGNRPNMQADAVTARQGALR